MRIGSLGQRTHDYARHGTSTLFAAPDIATGKVTGLRKPRHRHQEFLLFLKHLARAEGRSPGVAGENPRIHVYFTPKSSHG
ncbi:transposase [Rhodococcus sp. JVH1]|uniref:transposase n=1 Tax=Rhodococcus sp. JVH1 TaxID=745408 RepID=UPI000271EAF6|nr:transposase [Rhodococcus sp. JVH1]EJI94087.1 putative transposase [Rhodococcus sp. JVH1]